MLSLLFCCYCHHCHGYDCCCYHLIAITTTLLRILLTVICAFTAAPVTFLALFLVVNMFSFFCGATITIVVMVALLVLHVTMIMHIGS